MSASQYENTNWGSVGNNTTDQTLEDMDSQSGNTDEGFFDHVAGSIDEAHARQFDDEQGGGIADYDTWAGVADHAAGSTDEATARQFDGEQGGGVADYDTWAGVADHAAGSTDEWVGQNSMMIQAVIGLVLVMVLLYLARPLLEGFAASQEGS